MEDELKALVDMCQGAMDLPVTLTPEAAFLVKHGDVLIAALELAEAVDAYDHEEIGDRLDPASAASTPELQAAYKALDAYRKAKEAKQ